MVSVHATFRLRTMDSYCHFTVASSSLGKIASYIKTHENVLHAWPANAHFCGALTVGRIFGCFLSGKGTTGWRPLIMVSAMVFFANMDETITWACLAELSGEDGLTTLCCARAVSKVLVIEV